MNNNQRKPNLDYIRELSDKIIKLRESLRKSGISGSEIDQNEEVKKLKSGLLQAVEDEMNQIVSRIKEIGGKNEEAYNKLIEEMDNLELELQNLSENVDQTCADLDQMEKKFEGELDKIIPEEQEILKEEDKR